MRLLIMEEPSVLNKDTAELACSIIPEMATTEQTIFTKIEQRHLGKLPDALPAHCAT